MHFQATMYVIPLLLAAALSGALSLYALRHRMTVGSLGFAAMTLAVTVWSLGYALEIAGADLATKIVYAKIQYFAIVTVPVAWLVFALQFSQRQQWLTRRTILLLLGIPAATWLLAVSNETHRLIWRDTSLDYSGPFLALQVNHGGWFWVHFGYSYLLLLLGTILIGIAVVRTTHIYRRQALTVLLATLFPWVGNVLYLAGLNPIPQLDLTPLTFTLTSIIWAWSIFSFRLLDLAPVAREAVLEAMRDGVLTLDTQDRIVDMNPAAAQMIGVTNHQAIGQSAAQVLGSQFALLKQHPSDVEAQTELTVGEGAMRRDIQLRMSQIEDRQARPLGRLIILRDITDHRRAEQALQESEERFRRLAEAAFEGVAVHEEGRIIDANQALADLFGYTSAELLGKSAFDLLVREARDIIRLQLESASQDSYETIGLRKDGSTLLIEVSGRTTPYQGRIARIVTIRDITRHKENEQLLRVQANQIALLNQITRASIETHDLDHMLQMQAERLGELLGADACYIDLWDQARREMHPVAASGRLQGIYPGLKLAANQRLWTRAVLEAGHTLVAEEALNAPQIAPSLAKRLALSSAIGLPLISGDSKFGAAMITFNQPHHFSAEEIALAEQAARQIALAVANARLYQAITDERSRLQAMITSSRDGVVLIGTDQRILVINESALRLLHMPGSLDEWTNRSINAALELMHQYAPAAVSSTQQEMQRVQAGDEQPGEGEYEVQSRFIHWLNLPVRAGVTALGRLLVLHDVTEERMLERLRTDLTSTMVHDLRNPLTAMVGALNLIEMLHKTKGDISDFLQIAVRSTNMMLGLVNAILDVSRLESGHIVLNCAWHSLDDLAEEIFGLQEPLAKEKNQQLINALPQLLPLVWADHDLMRRVFQNLIGNAIKFTPEGGSITITAHLQGDDQAQILVAISDTGPGIPTDLRSRLFEKFVTGTTIGGGSGLGLAFCRLAIEAHGGTIWIEDNLDQGTIFKFILPTIQEFHTIQNELLDSNAVM
ncbi:MAG: histidine kinase N-terminal 7TM domain-containing protein [Roseiflexaceae bacterium]